LALGSDPNRARRALNLATINGMADAFKKGGKQAIDKVMRNNPAMFLKMLVLLVPRELQVEHTGGIKAMSDEQIERAIEAIEELIAKRQAGGNAKVIEGVAAPDVGEDVGTARPKAKAPTKSTDGGG
jgi:hypothetical protein